MRDPEEIRADIRAIESGERLDQLRWELERATAAIRDERVPDREIYIRATFLATGTVREGWLREYLDGDNREITFTWEVSNKRTFTMHVSVLYEPENAEPGDWAIA